ncbi:MAG: DUF4256 domain-containing protein [Leptospiraceae bacterium]|nr:DUF4256 domain-containing protein [Leptospiraceae bacterium]
MPLPKKNQSSSEDIGALLETLKVRFEKNPQRHPNLKWSEVEKKLTANKEKLHSLSFMEGSGGEPDVVVFKPKSKEIIFCDCSPESPTGRRSLCYDEDARRSRKQFAPAGSALGMAQAMGIELLDEEKYYLLQNLGAFDLKTSSWLLTPPEIRQAGGALFGDRRYGRVFTYHNSAESYYAARGFRGFLKL